MEPNIIFYQQPSQSKLSKVLDDLTFTDESENTPRTLPTVLMNKVDSETSKEEVIFSPDVKVKDKSFKSPKIIKPMLGKRPRPVEDDELSFLFSTTSAI
jgi:hypothetical protein